MVIRTQLGVEKGGTFMKQFFYSFLVNKGSVLVVKPSVFVQRKKRDYKG